LPLKTWGWIRIRNTSKVNGFFQKNKNLADYANVKTEKTVNCFSSAVSGAWLARGTPGREGGAGPRELCRIHLKSPQPVSMHLDTGFNAAKPVSRCSVSFVPDSLSNNYHMLRKKDFFVVRSFFTIL
jgi:hypothetical protein